jgi:hypothetical protein
LILGDLKRSVNLGCLAAGLRPHDPMPAPLAYSPAEGAPAPWRVNVSGATDCRGAAICH